MNFDIAILIAVSTNIIISIATLFLVGQERMSRQGEDEDEDEEVDPEFLSRDLDTRLRDLQTRRFGVTMDPRPRFRHVDKKEK